MEPKEVDLSDKKQESIQESAPSPKEKMKQVARDWNHSLSREEHLELLQNLVENPEIQKSEGELRTNLDAMMPRGIAFDGGQPEKISSVTESLIFKVAEGDTMESLILKALKQNPN